jgi:DNA mismatch endonuclease (patch repair protein)
MDKVSPEVRSYVMSRIRSRDTSIEVMFAEQLRKQRLKFEQHAPFLGRPDFVFNKAGVVVFLDSCFWHKCPYHYREPKSRVEYWRPKITRNVERDRRIRRKYRGLGWCVIQLWEHQIVADMNKWVAKTADLVRSRRRSNQASLICPVAEKHTSRVPVGGVGEKSTRQRAAKDEGTGRTPGPKRKVTKLN